MANKLVSKNMPTDNRNLRNTLISNFEIIQPYLDWLDSLNMELDSKLAAQDEATVKRLTEQSQVLTARINRIITY
ncbi:hypothetical protein C4O30_00030 [Lactiplantibacillus plantarum]|uniref:hypothetical protein n=1 Tax=Lactiplantibacillus plantarum TaxID=1590 RepID=UPI000CE954CF|nr:hypothetical protein [Lactiplantibacillus plantarum]AVE81478.1 hypothetical protein C4O30_00030 [Lactiplantibacillus plantarum]